jgi:hypothetical protein
MVMIIWQVQSPPALLLTHREMAEPSDHNHVYRFDERSELPPIKSWRQC